MNVQALEYDKSAAKEKYRLYREHLAAQTEVDRELEAIYHQISRGKKVIAALQSIVAAGLGPGGLPLLAIAPAHWERVDCQVTRLRTTFRKPNVWRGGTTMGLRGDAYKSGTAIVPHIPFEHRPKAKLHNYSILWEADWKAVPVDPMLLRKVPGTTDAWVVLAAWDLTPLERSVLAARMTQ